MNDSGEELDVIGCASYTHGRRHPEVLGSLGMTRLPFQVTGPALVAGAGVGVVMVFGWMMGGWWTWLLPTSVNAVLCVVVPIVVGVASQMLRIDGRNPLVGCVAFARYGLRSRHGVVAGRPAPRARSFRMSCRGFVCGTVE
jgi:hypothetical protein